MTWTYADCAQELRNRLRTMRTERRWSQDELSEELDGLHRKSLQSRLSRLETGEASFTLQDVFRLAEVFGRDFFNGVGFPFQDVTVIAVTPEARAEAPPPQLR